MKFPAVLLCAVMAAGVMQAETKPVTKPSAAKPAPETAAPAVKKDEKKEAPLPKIPGVVINRANGTFLGLEVVSGNFKLSFYDKKHKLMAVDVTRATARWPNRRTALPAEYRTVLNPSGTALVGARPVLPPFPINVHLTLLQGEGDEAKAVEQYDVSYSG